MSLLDENLDIDIIHTVVLNYLNSAYMYYDNINLKNGYYRFDELMDDYTENDYYKDFIDNPEKVNIYWWFDSSYMRLFVCRSNKIPLKLNPRYTKYLSCDLWGMIDRLNINQFKL